MAGRGTNKPVLEKVPGSNLNDPREKYSIKKYAI
jgi:hypothetical protein